MTQFGDIAARNAAKRKPRKRREASVGRYFYQRMKEAGAIVYKQTPIGRRGKADRSVYGWNGRHIQVELKKDGKEPEDHQAREHDRLRRRGHTVLVISTKAEVDALADYLLKYKISADRNREMSQCSI